MGCGGVEREVNLDANDVRNEGARRGIGEADGVREGKDDVRGIEIEGREVGIRRGKRSRGGDVNHAEGVLKEGIRGDGKCQEKQKARAKRNGKM